MASYTIWPKEFGHSVVRTSRVLRHILLWCWFLFCIDDSTRLGILYASFWYLDIRINFQASITAKVSAGNEDGRFRWLRNLRSNSSKRCSMGFRSGFWEGQSSIWKPTSAYVSMCVSYPLGREVGFPRNNAIELGEKHCPKCSHKSQSSCQHRIKGPSPNHENTPHHDVTTTKLYSRFNAVI